MGRYYCNTCGHEISRDPEPDEVKDGWMVCERDNHDDPNIPVPCPGGVAIDTEEQLWAIINDLKGRVEELESTLEQHGLC